MSKRVYEIAREQSLESKEVIQRLKEAGVQVKSHSSSVEDNVYERVFGAGPSVETPNGRSAAQEAEAQEARADAERSGHGATMAEAPAEEPITGPQQSRPQKKRRRVVIDASARNRGARPAAPAAPAPSKEPERAPVEEEERESSGVRVEPGATVKDLGDALGVPPTQIIKVLMGLGEMKTLTQTLSTEEIELVSEELGVEVEIGAVEEPEPVEVTPDDDPADLVEKPPVVTVMGHVDDGIMPQTAEAIEHARAAGVPMVVALNKIDVPNANQDKVLGELSERELVPEVYGGDTVTVPVSAKTGEGIDELLENILVVAELEDLKANPKAPASGYVIEGERDPGRGPVATLLLSRGTLEKSDAVLAGTAYGRVRAMLDFMGNRLKEAGPGTPVEILGLSSVPEAGTRFEVVDHERIARDRAQQAEERLRRQELAQGGTRRTLEELLGEGGTQDLNLVIKADVAGSVEALKEALARLSTDEVRVNIVRSGVGALTDSDVMLASASDGILLGFNVRPTSTAKQVAEREGVEIRTYDVIYKALEEIEAAMRGMLAPETAENETGTAEVRQTSRLPSVGVVAGCCVTSGEIFRNNRVRVGRDGTVVYEGNRASLKRFRDDVRSVREGFECGVGVENFNDVKEGDVLEFFETVEVPR